MELLQGYIYCILGFVLWGIVPFFWKQLPDTNAFEFLFYRVVFGSLVAIPVYIFSKEKFSKVLNLFKNNWKVIIISTLLIAINWFIFVYAVINKHIVDASIGYFINPIFNVFLGYVLFKEKLNKFKLFSISLIIISLGLLLSDGVSEFWISFSLFFTFGLYGMVKKRYSIPAFDGLILEMIILTIFLGVYFFTMNNVIFFEQTSWNKFLLFLAGPVTILPLWLFNKGVQIIPLSSVGMIQYITPTSQFLIGVLIYGEILTERKVFIFTLIWVAVISFLIPDIRKIIKKSRGFP